jgi:hypothetical protein
MVRRRVVASDLAIEQKIGFAVLAVFAFFLAAAEPSGAGLQAPEQFLGHKVGADNKLVRWDKAVEYFKLAAASSDRVRFRELGKTSNGNPFIVLEISSADTLKNLDRYKQLEQYQFTLTSIHNDDVKAGRLRQKFDAIVIADQDPRAIVDGYDAPAIRPEYRGGISEAGVASLKQFVADGGTLVTMGNACDLAIERFPIPVRNLKKGLTRDQHFAPGTIVRLEIDAQHPIGYGVAPETYGFYVNSPFFSIVEGFASQRTTVVARYPNTNVVASGWLKGEDLMAGRAAVVSIDMNPGKLVLFGLRPQHRAQTHATFPLLFNALYLSALGDGTKTSN